MMQKPIPVSAVEYLNTAVLVRGLRKLEKGGKIELFLDHPADCAKKLAVGKTQIGLVPVVTLPELRPKSVFSSYCIGATGEVRTVVLVSKVPLEQLREVRLDSHSRTSVELLKSLISLKGLEHIQLVDGQPGFETEELEEDCGMLIIGDKVFSLEHKYPYRLDLSNEWYRHYQLPFVFATWVSMIDLPKSFQIDFDAALQLGLDQISQVAVDYGTRLGFEGVNVPDYLSKNISYTFDSEKKKGLAAFFEKIGYGNYRIPYV